MELWYFKKDVWLTKQADEEARAMQLLSQIADVLGFFCLYDAILVIHQF